MFEHWQEKGGKKEGKITGMCREGDRTPGTTAENCFGEGRKVVGSATF